MAVKLNSLKIDTRKENDGEWVDIPSLVDPETGEMVALKVRGIGYSEYQSDLSKLRKRWVTKYGSMEDVPDRVARQELGRLYARHLLLDWRGFDPPYDPDIAEEELTSRGELAGHVLYAANKNSQADIEYTKAAAKNSSPSSDGN